MKQKSKKTVAARVAEFVQAGPISIYAVIFIIIPFLVLLFMSFMTKGPLGTIQYKFTLDNYKTILEPVYWKVVKDSIVIAGISTIATVFIGYHLAYYVAGKKPGASNAMLMLMMIPFWASELVILYSFVTLFNKTGIINTFLLNIGLIQQPLNLLYNKFAIVVGMVYSLLPFAVLPMYSSIEKMDKSLLEASKDLGAGPVKTFLNVTLPLTAPGMFAAVILVFIPSIGYYMITDMLGGGTNIMIGNIIYNQFTVARNWPFGSALSIILAVIILIMVAIYSKMGGDLDDLGV